MARAALDRLPQGKAELVFYRVPPLASIAWQQLKKGDQAGAAQTLDQALKTEADCPLPETGNFSVDTAAWLAAALVAAGRDQEARTLIQRFPASGAKGKLFAAMGFAAARKTWDVEAAQHDRPLWDVASLEWPVVIELAVAQGYPTEALRFAELRRAPRYVPNARSPGPTRSRSEICSGPRALRFPSIRSSRNSCRPRVPDCRRDWASCSSPPTIATARRNRSRPLWRYWGL